MRVDDGRVREGAGGLAGLDRRVDPALVEERLGQRGHARIESGVGVEHGGARLGPRDLAVVVARQRRVAVPDLQLLEPEPARLERVVAVRQPGIGRDHRVAQRRDHLGLHVVGEVARGLRRGQFPPAVLDLLLLGQRVGHAGEQRRARGEHRRQRLGAGLAPRAVGVGEQVERGFEPERLAVDLEGQPGHGLVEQPVPGGGADDRLVVQELLQLIGELVGLHRADAVEDGLVAAEVGVRREEGVEAGVVDPVQLEGEEHQRGRQVGDGGLLVAKELRPGGIGGVLVVAQPGEAHDPAGDRLDALVAEDRRQQTRGVEVAELALVVAREGGALRAQPLEVAGEFRSVLAGVEVTEVPFRKRTEVGGGGCVAGVADERWAHRMSSG